MSNKESRELAFAENGNPILDQLSEHGFIDCTFRIVNLVSGDREHRFHLAAWFNGETVGFDVVVVKGIRGAFTPEMKLISEHVYYEGVKFIRSGVESDRLLTALSALYDLPEQRQMVDRFSFTTIALHLDNVDMEIEPISMKLFGNDGEDMSEDDYFECFFNLDLPSGFAFWNEKDPDYREPLIRGLCHSE